VQLLGAGYGNWAVIYWEVIKTGRLQKLGGYKMGGYKLGGYRKWVVKKLGG
jgi:hypothetical protein